MKLISNKRQLSSLLNRNVPPTPIQSGIVETKKDTTQNFIVANAKADEHQTANRKAIFRR